MPNAEAVSYEHFVQLLGCLQAWYSYSRGDYSMGSVALEALTYTTLEAVMGEPHFTQWLTLLRQHRKR